ncbi:MAG: hypothetical protein Q7S33_02245 [Nanoarchaeota archaeon]|nr:hypothetical protein [Nanoarchaeota archaeon]
MKKSLLAILVLPVLFACNNPTGNSSEEGLIPYPYKVQEKTALIDSCYSPNIKPISYGYIIMPVDSLKKSE